MQEILKHKFLFGAALVMFAVFAWYFLSPSSSSDSDSALSSTPADTTDDQNIIQSLLALQTVTLSGTIFSDPGFKSLQDFSTTIVPESVGRADPFAPVSGVQTVTQSTSSAAVNALFKKR